MKKVNFKKWIVISVVSFVLTIVFLGVSIFSGGSSIIRAIGNMDNMFDDGFSMVANGMMNGNLNEDYFSTYNMHDSSTSGHDSGIYTYMMDDDAGEYKIATELQSLPITEPIETKEQLDTYLQQIATEVNGKTHTANDKENVIDVVEDNVSFYFDTTPLPTDALATDDYEDYFERTHLNNKGCSDYIETTLRAAIN